MAFTPPTAEDIAMARAAAASASRRSARGSGRKQETLDEIAKEKDRS